MASSPCQRKFFVALDETSVFSVRRVLEQYGYSFSPSFKEEAILAEFASLRKRIFTCPAFSGEAIEGVILPYESSKEIIEGKTVPFFLLQKGIPSYLKIDDGIMKEEHGLKVPTLTSEELDIRLSYAHLKGCKGVKLRSFIYSSDASLIKNAVKKELKIAQASLQAGLRPIVEFDVDTHIADREKAEERLYDELSKKSDKAIKEGQLIYRFSFPSKNGFYASLLEKESVNCLLASSSNLSKEDALAKLKDNPELIPSFSRAFLDNLKASMDEKEFTVALETTIEELSHC